ncbi:MAG: hypothetical protein D6682_02430 [Zetaproteobacteria bacterium]|nr:MAG: hypothetical protein D6682_02430 [Zetaproteobacteria bacterium]
MRDLGISALLVCALLFTTPWGSAAAGEVDLLLKQVQQRLDKQQWDRARSLLERAKRTDRLNADVYRLYGLFYELQRQFRKARTSYRHAVMLDKGNVRALIGLARVYKQLGSPIDAVPVYNKLADVDADNAIRWRLKAAEIYVEQGKQAAEKYLKQVLREQPDNRQALALMVRLYNAVGMRAIARRYQKRLDRLMAEEAPPNPAAPVVATQREPKEQKERKPHHTMTIAASSAGDGPAPSPKAREEALHPVPPPARKKSPPPTGHHYNEGELAIRDIEDQIRDLRQAIQEQEQMIGAAQDRLRIQEAELDIRRGKEQRLREKKDEALAKLQQLEALAHDDPSISTENARERYQQQLSAYKNARQERLSLEEAITLGQGKIRGAAATLERLKEQMGELEMQARAARQEALRRRIEREQTVTAHGEVSCGDYSIKVCRQMALEEAKRNAVEKGSAVVIDSLTEMKDMELTRDEVRSRVQATLIRTEVVDKGMIGESGYFYDIRAVVKGKMPPQGLSSGPANAPDAAKADDGGEPPRRKVHLYVTPTPGYATVTLQGVDARYVPGIALPPGRYTIRVEAAGYQPITQQVVLQKSDMTVPIVMTRVSENPPDPAPAAPAARPALPRKPVPQAARRPCPRRARKLISKAKLTYAPNVAYRLLVKAEEICPSSPELHYLMGNLLAHRGQPGDLDRALDQFLMTRSLAPGYPGIDNRIQQIKLRLQQRKQGLRSVLKALLE